MEYKTSPAKRKANARFDKKNTKMIVVKLNKNTDKDILDLLESVDNTQGFIKQLLRKEISSQIQA